MSVCVCFSECLYEGVCVCVGVLEMTLRCQAHVGGSEVSHREMTDTGGKVE